MTSCAIADEFEESEDDLDMFMVVPDLEDRESGEPSVDGGGVPAVKSDYDTSARGIALLQLLNLRDTLVSRESQDAMTRAHRQLLVINIDHALDREVRGRS